MAKNRSGRAKPASRSGMELVAFLLENKEAAGKHANFTELAQWVYDRTKDRYTAKAIRDASKIAKLQIWKDYHEKVQQRLVRRHADDEDEEVSPAQEVDQARHLEVLRDLQRAGQEFYLENQERLIRTLRDTTLGDVRDVVKMELPRHGDEILRRVERLMRALLAEQIQQIRTLLETHSTPPATPATPATPASGAGREPRSFLQVSAAGGGQQSRPGTPVRHGTDPSLGTEPVQ